jgi:hypothetical protein
MNILTAEEFLEEMDKDNDDLNSIIERAMIEFAKTHVEAALKLASENAEMEYEPDWSGEQEDITYINRDSILNAYPLTNIK